jgi:hypothetical protein
MVSLQHTKETKSKYFNSIGYLVCRYSRVLPSILLALLVSPLCLSHSCHCLYIIFSRCIPLTSVQNGYTRLVTN